MSKRVLLFTFLVLSLSVSFLFAATTGKISGTVKDAQTGEPLPGANITIKGTQMGAATDVEGEYFIINIPPGMYNVTASMIGYTTVTKTEVRVKIDQTTPLNFDLSQEVISGEEVTVIAERPVVEVDLTSSKQVMSSENISQSFITNVEQAVEIQQGVNYNGGIRGGFGLNVAYYVDGMEIRDAGSNSNYTGLNTSAIQEMEVLTGGYNAEYGRANGAVVNIVTKAAKDRVHGSINYRFRPAGIYHWGGHIYGDDRYENRVIFNPANIGYWEDLNKSAWMEEVDWDEGDGLYELQRYARSTYYTPYVLKYLKDYDEKQQHEVEGTLYGPITNKLSYMLSGRFKRGAPKFPSILEYNPEWNAQVRLEYDFTQNTKLRLQVLHGGYDNSQGYKSTYGSSEDGHIGRRQNGAFIHYPKNRWKFFPWANQGTPSEVAKAPEYTRIWSGQLKLTHTFNPSTFMDVSLSHYQLKREANHRRLDWMWENDFLYSHVAHSKGDDPARGIIAGRPWLGVGKIKGTPWGLNYPSDQAQDYVSTWNNKLEADITKQLNDVHQIKAGGHFSYQYVDRYIHFGYISTSWALDPIPRWSNPWEGGLYLQDKIETKGMIVNVGLRMDVYNANMYVSDDIFDPLRIDEETPGNIGQDQVSIGNPYVGERRRITSEDANTVKTPTQISISPRIGISHPITETTVLHFMYGHFNQRPPWQKIMMLPYTRLRPYPATDPYLTGYHKDYDGVSYQGSWGGGNPALDFEKMIQYEVGFDQSIADKLRLDVTMYYKDGKNMTAGGYQSGMGQLADYGTTTYSYARLLPDYDGGDSVAPGKSGENGAWVNNVFQDVRGIEMTAETQFRRYFNLRLMYNMSYANTGRYGLSEVYREFPDGRKKEPYDSRYGANNGDQGRAGNNNQYWNPNNQFKLTANFFTPRDFGPNFGGVHPIGDFNVNWYTTWSQGIKYTWHAPDDLDPTPFNMRWKPQWNTNLKVSKGLNFGGGLRAEFSVRVINLFNQNQLRLPGGSWRDIYHLEGRLPYFVMGYDQWREEIPDEWNWYNANQLPREIIFGIGFEF